MVYTIFYQTAQAVMKFILIYLFQILENVIKKTRQHSDNNKKHRFISRKIFLTMKIPKRKYLFIEYNKTIKIKAQNKLRLLLDRSSQIRKKNVKYNQYQLILLIYNSLQTSKFLFVIFIAHRTSNVLTFLFWLAPTIQPVSHASYHTLIEIFCECIV